LVDKALIAGKLARIEAYLELARKQKDPGLAAFRGDRELQSIILFNTIQAIQLCIDIGAHIISDSGWEPPATQAAIFETLAQKKVITRALAEKMIRMAGFRNRIVHEYEKTDMEIVHTVWRKHLADILKFCKAVILTYKI
jgi:uncharacterized protein YutE (UPF0331/DUF86 family)